MATVYDNIKAGTITDNPLSSGATTINSAAFANLPEVTGSDILWITLDPDAVNGAPEIVKVTAHTAAATSVTVTRAQQSTTARAHPVNSVWKHAVTKTDLDAFLTVVTTADITDANVTTAKLAADAVTGAQIADDQIDSEHYVAGSIDAEHLASDSVTTAKIADANVTLAKMAANSVDSDQYVDGSIDTAHLADEAVTLAKIVSPYGADLGTITTRFGCTLARSAVQSIPNNTFTSITLDAEVSDPDGFITVPSTTVTVPAGGGGLYAITAKVTYATATLGAWRVSLSLNSGVQFYPAAGPNTNEATIAVVLPLVAGDQIVVQTLHNNGAAQNATCRLEMYRVGL